ncbi:MAG: tagatose 1,6-diphosphate aldolase [Chloroflexi bacterium]|nr:tagatose 1,6-diphosphate aldolase [Chloroflexota bacterium]
MQLSIGKIRGLQQIATPSGHLVMCAMDHRSGLVSMMEGIHHGAPDYAEIVQMKLDICSVLGTHSSGILLDPEYGASQCIASGVLGGQTGLLVSIEATGYQKDPTGRLTVLLKDWSVEKIKRMGASAVKMLVYFRPDITKLAARQLEVIAGVAGDCIKYDIPLLVEPKTYRVEGETLDSAAFARSLPQMVIETARQITALPIDVLKAEFPADLKYEQDADRPAGYCRQLDQASSVPWVILSAGVDYDTFKRQVTIACQAGASGFLGGRAIWQEATEIESRDGMLSFLSGVAVKRMQELAEITGRYARPWYSKFGLSGEKLADTGAGWYSRY